MTQYGTLHDVNKKQLYVNFFQELTFLLIFLLTESTFFLQIGQLESTFFRKLHFPSPPSKILIPATEGLSGVITNHASKHENMSLCQCK